MNARTMPLNWHPAAEADYSVEVCPNYDDGGTRLFDIAPAGWDDAYNPRTDQNEMQGPWDRVRAKYRH